MSRCGRWIGEGRNDRWRGIAVHIHIEAMIPSGRALVFLASLVTVFGCGRSDPLGPSFVAELTIRGGCADVVFYAVDDDDELMLSFRAEGLVSEARSAGEGEAVTIFEFPAAAQLTLEQGTRVSDAMCDDVIENGGPKVSRTWTAVSGTATARVRPQGGEDAASADLLLEEVVFEGDEGESVTVGRLEWTDVRVGWYPG